MASDPQFDESSQGGASIRMEGSPLGLTLQGSRTYTCYSYLIRGGGLHEALTALIKWLALIFWMRHYLHSHGVSYYILDYLADGHQQHA